ncbi:MAG: hypothetical protein H3C59_03800 [Burkholderiaceae bacterium]|nr:hypothetical protein [Burkholderiaceae bacterium]
MRGLACVVLALGSLAGGVQAADDSAAIEARVRALAERMERLEQRNQELEREVAEWRRRGGAQAAPAAAGSSSTLEARVHALEEAQARTEQSLATDRLRTCEANAWRDDRGRNGAAATQWAARRWYGRVSQYASR